MRRATCDVVSTLPAANTLTASGPGAVQDAARDWQAVRGDSAIQYAPLPDPVVHAPRPLPPWLKALGEFLRDLFEPIGRALGMNWTAVQWVLASLAALAVLYALWRAAAPLLSRWRARTAAAGRAALAADEAWTPDRNAALTLLDDADRLAAAGRYGEAAHLLLQRSVHHIAEARPDWVHPASTAREIAALPALPPSARDAFATIAARVERSLFALAALEADDWHAARDAYARFALERFPMAGNLP